MNISQLIIYPIKSCAGIPVNSAEVTELGFKYDRMFVVTDIEGNFVTQRKFPSMALIRPRIEGDVFTISAPSMTDSNLSLERIGEEKERVKLWKDECLGLHESQGADEWFSIFLHTPCKLMRYQKDSVRMRESNALQRRIPVSFADSYPFLVISQESLDEFNTHLQQPIPSDRFRPNIVLSGCKPYQEDEVKELHIGNVVLEGVNKCVRCTMPAINQQTGEREGDEVLQALKNYRNSEHGVIFGRKFIPLTYGEVNVGDFIGMA